MASVGVPLYGEDSSLLTSGMNLRWAGSGGRRGAGGSPPAARSPPPPLRQPRPLVPPRPGCPSWLGLHDPGSELGSASLSLGGRRCEQPPAFLPRPYLGERRTPTPLPQQISITLSGDLKLRGALQQTWVGWGWGSWGDAPLPTLYCCPAHPGPRDGFPTLGEPDLLLSVP